MTPQQSSTVEMMRYSVPPILTEETEMPEIYRRKDSRKWWATYTDYRGHRRRESLGTEDKELARMALARRVHLHYMTREGFISPEQLRTHDRGRTLLECIDNQPPHVRTFIAFARFKIASDFATDTTVAKLCEWLATMDDLQPRTRNRKLWDVQAFGDRLWREGFISTNAAIRVKAAKETGERVKPHRAFTPAEAERLIDGCPERYRLFYRLRFWTGLRGSEARLVERRDFDLGDRPTLTVRAEVAKNGLSGTLPLPDVLTTELAPLSMLAPTTCIFRDLPRSDNRRDKLLRRHLDSLGFDSELNGRSFRMTFNTWLKAAGVELGVIMSLRRDKGAPELPKRAQASAKLAGHVYHDRTQTSHLLFEAMAKLEAWHSAALTNAGRLQQCS